MANTSRSRPDAPLPPIQLDPAIRNQSLRVRAGLRAAILDGLLPPGTRLPSSRDLSRTLGIGRNAVVAAFEHLISDGLIEARHGSGTFVSPQLPPAQQTVSAPDLALAYGKRPPFALGQTHVEPDFLARLGAATRRAIALARPADLAYGDPRGTRHLRTQIAETLAANRGIRCDPDCIIVVTGTQHGLRLCADALLTPGDTAWFEDPGYNVSRATLTAAGMTLATVPVDAAGLDVAAGIANAPDARAVYVTPSHQFPTGVRMEMTRRAALIDWAEATGAWVFEDDYDSEFRYSGPPLTALAGLSPNRVIYLGTFAKTLFPGLRLGYIVVPPDALERVLRARPALDRFQPAFLQNAVADLLADGTVATPLRRNLRRYRAARDLVAQCIVETSEGRLTPDVPEHGLHLIAWLPVGTSTATATGIRSVAGVETLLVSETRMQQGAREGFVLGFSGHMPEDLSVAATALGRATLIALSSTSAGPS